MQEGPDEGDVTDDDYRMTAELRGANYSDAGRGDLPHHRRRRRVARLPARPAELRQLALVLLAASRGARVSAAARGPPRQRDRHSRSTTRAIGTGSHPYRPDPHFVYLGVPAGRAGLIDATLPGRHVQERLRRTRTASGVPAVDTARRRVRDPKGGRSDSAALSVLSARHPAFAATRFSNENMRSLNAHALRPPATSPAADAGGDVRIVILGLTVACGQRAASPVSPTPEGASDPDAAADGSTLKATDTRHRLADRRQRRRPIRSILTASQGDGQVRGHRRCRTGSRSAAARRSSTTRASSAASAPATT